MKEFGVAAVPMKIIENKSGSYNTRMTEDKPTWLIGTEEEIKRKWFFAGPTCYTIKEREEELKAPARRTLEDFIPKTSEEEANSPPPPEAMERAREELQQDAKAIHDEGYKLLRELYEEQYPGRLEENSETDRAVFGSSDISAANRAGADRANMDVDASDKGQEGATNTKEQEGNSLGAATPKRGRDEEKGSAVRSGLLRRGSTRIGLEAQTQVRRRGQSSSERNLRGIG